MSCTELDTLQYIIDREYSFNSSNRWRKPDYASHIKPLVIVLDTWLRRHGYNDNQRRREARLYIYSAITRKSIETTYDLSAYQCRSITGYLEDFDTQSITKDGEKLLSFLTEQFEAGTVLDTRGSDRPKDAGSSTSVSSLPF